MRVTKNEEKVTRLTWMTEQLDKEHADALIAAHRHACELSNQSVPPLPAEDDEEYLATLEAIKRLEDEQLYARMTIKTLEEIPPAFGTIESELGHAMIWHITPQGEQYWMNVHGLYGERRFHAARSKALAVQTAMRKAEAESQAGGNSDETDNVSALSRVERDSSDNQ